MPRKFTTTAISQYVKGTGPVFSSAEYADLLGSADEVTLQLVTEQVTGTTPKVTVNLLVSNDGVHFPNRQSSVFSNIEVSEDFSVMSGAIAGNSAFGKVEAKFTGNEDNAGVIKIIACGRTF